MYSFTKEQQKIQIGSITFGGQPGEYPTVLFGGLFFKGNPDYPAAQTHLQAMLDISERIGIPAIPDFFIKKEKYIDGIIEFLMTALPKQYPFSVDIIDPSLKIAVIEALANHHLLQRTIYNSIHIGTTEEEIQILKRHTPEMAILVAFNPKDKSPDGKIEILENGAHLHNNGLFSIAKSIGIQKILVDTAALAPGDNSGAAIAAIPVMKEEFGLPTGCAIHNVVEKSKWLDQFSDSKKLVDVASNINIPLFGGDFAIFGPIENAPQVFPLIAWQDILISEYTENYFGIQPTKHHPRRLHFQ